MKGDVKLTFAVDARGLEESKMKICAGESLSFVLIYDDGAGYTVHSSGNTTEYLDMYAVLIAGLIENNVFDIVMELTKDVTREREKGIMVVQDTKGETLHASSDPIDLRNIKGS